MSLDQIGPISKDVYGAKLLFDVIKGFDEKDATTYEKQEAKTKPKNVLTIGLSDDFKKLCDKEIYSLIEEKARELGRKNGWNIKTVSFEHIDLAVQSYYPICYVEFFSATRKFDGRKYGSRIENVCGPEVLRRILGGSEISKEEYHGLYYRRALKVKEVIRKEFDEAFKKVDVIICPTIPRLPHEIGSKISVEEMYGYDALTIPANLAGIPAISVPIGKIQDVPVGMQIIAPQFSEEIMLKVAEAAEKLK